MKIKFYYSFLLTFFILSSCFSQMTRGEILDELELDLEYEIEKIIKDNGIFIETTNNFGEENKQIIEIGLGPITHKEYRFNGSDNNSILKTVTTIHKHSKRYLIAMRSNEKNPTRQDYQNSRYADVMSIAYGPVEVDSNGMYTTRTIYFNFE